MQKDTFETYKDLGETVTSLDEAVNLRLMALEDEKLEDGTQIEVVDENGETEIVDVKTIGAGTLTTAQRATEIELAQASADWHIPEDK